MISKLKKNSKIKLANGTIATINDILGEGGQGVVYSVSINGKNYALKLYIKRPSKAFMDNLDENIRKGAPTKHFLWALWMVNSNRYWGYVMDIRPKEYIEFSKFLIAKARFASWSAMINAALQITYAFRELHRKGLSYQDLNDGNFFFNPQTGDALICDNDNVCPPNANLGIKGKARYMAPEVVLCQNSPNNLSDYFSLSVVLFMLLFNNHPLDGKRVASVPCLNDAIERHVYGENPVFIYDTNDKSNRPVPGIHQNVIIRWHLFPEFVRNAFTHSFSKDVLMNPNKRYSDNDWLKLLTQFRNHIIQCSCGNETFLYMENSHIECFNCKQTIDKPLVITIGKQQIPLYPGVKLYACHTSNEDDMFKISGEVVRNAKDSSIWGVLNKSNDSWTCVLPNGKSLDIQPGKGFPIYRNISVLFAHNKTGKIE